MDSRQPRQPGAQPGGDGTRIQARRSLRPAEVDAILALTARCRTHDGLDFTPGAGFLTRPPDAPGAAHFLAFRQGQLAGYLSLVGYSRPELEASAFVDPAQRRQGIFRALARAAGDEGRRHGAQRLLFVCERACPAGVPAAAALGGQYAFSEHRMTLTASAAAAAPGPVAVGAGGLELRPATEADEPALVDVARRAFDRSYQDAARGARFNLSTPGRHPFLATLQDRPLGIIATVDVGQRGADVVGFGVVPEHRRRGYGRAILACTVARLRAQGKEPIALDVETENEHALALYRSCGFQRTSTFDYLALPL